MVSTIRALKDAMSIATLNDIFFAAVERNLDRIMLYREAGKWLPVTSREFGRRVARTARYAARLGRSTGRSRRHPQRKSARMAYRRYG